MITYRKWMLWLVGVAAFAVLLGRYLDRVPQRHYCDFRVYHHAAQRILGGENIYFRDTMAVTPFKYSPFFAFCFIPLGVLPIKIAASLFFAANFILALVFFRLSSELMGSHAIALRVRMLPLLYGLVGMFVFRFVFLTWDSGQVGILLCVLVAASLFFSSRDKDALAGACLAAAILIKYMPALFIPYLLLQKKFKAVGWTAVFVIIWLALPALAVGVQKEISYLSLWLPAITESSLDQWSYVDAKNQSLISTVIRFCSDTGFGASIMHLTFEQGKFLGYGLAACLYLSALMPAPNRPRDQRIDYALLFCFLPLFNPNGWETNFVALTVAYMFLVGYLMENRWRDFFVAACVVAGFVISSLLAKDLAGKGMENHGEALGDVTIGALALVAALLKLKFTRAHIPEGK